MNKRDYFFKYKCVSEYTHLFMNGGKINVIQSMVPVFHDDYIDSIKNGNKLSIVEKVPKDSKFKMFFDIDNKDPIENIENYLNDFLKCFSKYKCIICASNGSFGIHIIFQDYHVDVKDAICIATNHAQNFNGIDTSVYNTGLRMVFSYKKNVPNYYIPKYIYTQQTLISLENTDIYNSKIIDACSILPIYCIPISIQDQGNNIKGNNIKGNNIKGNNIICLDFIDDHYKYVCVKKITKIQDYHILNTESKYCSNIKNYHKNAHIYFVVHNDYIYQKCFCKCSKENPCSNFVGKKHKVSYKIKALMKTF